MTLSVKGRSALVTGAGSGINLSFAKLLLDNGCNVLIADIGLRPEAQVLVDKHSAGAPRAVFQKTDVRDWKQLERMFEVAEKEFGELDIVCPGAGIYEPVCLFPFSNIESRGTISINVAVARLFADKRLSGQQNWSNFWRPPGTPQSRDAQTGDRYAVIDINFVHPIRTSQMAIAHFLRHGAGKGKARKHIIHISSIAGQNPAFAHPIYVATKHGINGLVRSLAQLDTKFGIRVTAVAPGVIKTPLWTDNPDKLKIIDEKSDEWVTPEEVSEVMLALIQQDEVSEKIGDKSGQGRSFRVQGGSILEVSKTVREVTAFNDPGPGKRAGNTASDTRVIDEEVVGILSQRGWGMSKL
ncbi:hypothetical protein MPDQ_001788 [Monascus purpureus]|uniref:NAD-dependent 15-hydroxyprostaglandin dehydrogenase n=1 Tax=Monascus purpureus TaxID=5098 RepID=A0A507R3U4_MONPU|nr:hypothetical protein MPDQ_001788 [Monascus purpureus]